MELKKTQIEHPFFDAIGRGTIIFFENLGRYCSTIWWMLSHMHNAKEYSRNIFSQMNIIGVSSIPIVLFISMFIGMVSAVQSAYQLFDWIPKSVVGSFVIKSVLLELVPLMSALVLAGKVGATITAEIGTMRVTEQIDALDALAFDSVSFLITPRVLSGTLMFPILVIFGGFVAVFGGFLGAILATDVPAEAYIKGIKNSFEVYDLFIGVIKATVFGFTITSCACYMGYNAQGGSEGVGKATMNTVIVSCLSVVVMDFIIASILT